MFDAIVSDIRPIMKKESPELVDTYDNLYNFFMARRPPPAGLSRRGSGAAPRPASR